MHPKASTFQAIVVADLVLFLLACFLPPSVFTSDQNMLDFLAYDGAGGPFSQPVGNAIFWFFVVGFTVTQIGMAFFRNWARYLFLVLSIANFMDQFLCGVRVTYPGFAAANTLLLTADGALLALMYWTPLAKYFDMKDPGTTPDRGPDPDEIVLR